MSEHKTKAQDSPTGEHEKKDTANPMSHSEAKAKGHANQEQKGHSEEKGNSSQNG